MPPKAAPKKGADGPSKKTEQKKREKIVEDKTFGIKNKKGTKQQKFIQTVSHQIKSGNQSVRKLEQMELCKGKKKDDKKKEALELNSLFKPVEQKVAKGVDPKSVLCAFFKQGQCKKGDKCKFSHDVTMGRKTEKKSVYTDVRDETMEDWDEAKLEEVVNAKHGADDKAKPMTAIICKFFLEAVENSKYGWFWKCPNSESCIYRHALPAGFVLKKDQKKDDKENEVSLEEYIEKERASMSVTNLTKLTLETFLKWKQRKKREKLAAMSASQDKKKSDYKQGKAFGISGRELFEFNPDLVAGDDDEADDTAYANDTDGEDEEEDNLGPVREINMMMFDPQAEGEACAGPGTIRDNPIANGPTKNNHKNENDAEASKLSMAAALHPEESSATATDAAIAAAIAATVNGEIAADVPIDENLFDGDDLDFVEDELETLDLSD